MSHHEAVAHARALLDLGRPREALQALQPALADPSACAETWRVKASCEAFDDRPKDSAMSARRAIALDPNDESGHRLLAVALMVMGDAGAVRAAAEAARLAPERPETGFVLTLTHLRSTRVADTAAAQAVAATLLRLHPHSPLAWEAQAEVAAACRRHEDAERAARRGLELAPHDCGLMRLLGDALEGQRRHAEAAQVFAASGRADVDGGARRSLGRAGMPRLSLGGLICAAILLQLGAQFGFAPGVPSAVVALFVSVFIGGAFVISERSHARARAQMPPNLGQVALDSRREMRRPWALVGALAALVVAVRALAVDEAAWAVVMVVSAVGLIVARRFLPRAPYGPLPSTWVRFPVRVWRAIDGRR